MKKYPATSRSFSVNGKTHKMKKLTLGLQADIEDENVVVTYRDVIVGCTDMDDDDINALHADQFMEIYEDIRAFTYDVEESGEGEPKKRSSSLPG